MANRFAKIVTSLLAIFLLVSVSWVLLCRFVPVRWTPLMTIRQYEAKQAGHPLYTQQKWVSLEDISPTLIDAVLQSEDAFFYEHSGFEWDAIVGAYRRNRAMGYIVAGGSTISQQTAKNVFCTLHRTYTRKAFETYFTLLIELLWGKERILEVYLNVIELGKGIYGVEAACQNRYGHSARYTSTNEAYDIAHSIPCPLWDKW